MSKSPEQIRAIADKIRRDDAYLIDYILGWAGRADPQPWGAAHGFALEMGAGYGLIRGESDATPTALGLAVAKFLAEQPA